MGEVSDVAHASRRSTSLALGLTPIWRVKVPSKLSQEYKVQESWPVPNILLQIIRSIGGKHLLLYARFSEVNRVDMVSAQMLTIEIYMRHTFIPSCEV